MNTFFYFLLSSLPLLISAHGYLSSPPPRGIQKASYQVDDLKSPNHKGLCRGEPVGQITKVRPGQQVTLGMTITAPHIGPCNVTILDANMQNPIHVADKDGCAAPGAQSTWQITLPRGLSGRKILRWYWEAHHVTPFEPYEQCVDLDFGGGNTSSNDEIPYSPPSNGPTYSNPTVNSASLPSSDSSAASFVNSGEPAPGSTSSPSGSCSAGSYQCASDGGFYQCANGAWVKMGCPASTQCQQNGNQIVCNWATSQ